MTELKAYCPRPNFPIAYILHCIFHLLRPDSCYWKVCRYMPIAVAAVLLFNLLFKALKPSLHRKKKKKAITWEMILSSQTPPPSNTLFK